MALENADSSSILEGLLQNMNCEMNPRLNAVENHKFGIMSEPLLAKVLHALGRNGLSGIRQL
jgi:hypothetical protein